MLDADGPDASATYPPARNTWEFPPPPSRGRWVWIVVVAVVLGVVAVGGLVTYLSTVVPGDLPGVIDDDRLVATIAMECSVMTTTVESLPVYGTAQQQSDAIRDQDQAIGLMVDAIRTEASDAVRADHPARQWLNDWDRLVVAREQLADELLRDPNASLDVPVDDDGDPVTQRMDDVWLGDPACEVPATIAAPDADALSG